MRACVGPRPGRVSRGSFLSRACFRLVGAPTRPRAKPQPIGPPTDQFVVVVGAVPGTGRRGAGAESGFPPPGIPAQREGGPARMGTLCYLAELGEAAELEDDAGTALPTALAGAGAREPLDWRWPAASALANSDGLSRLLTASPSSKSRNFWSFLSLSNSFSGPHAWIWMSIDNESDQVP